MPIYEFRCAACGARFEELVPAGGVAARCPECGAAGPERVLSAPAAPPRLVRTPRGMREQERKNAKLRDATKARLREGRRRSRERKSAAKRAGND